MDTQLNSRYGPHSEATAPNAMRWRDGSRKNAEVQVIALPPATVAQRRAINDLAHSEPEQLTRARVRAHYGHEADRCIRCGYVAWDLIAGVCGACRRTP
jgi:hypothetical protein